MRGECVRADRVQVIWLCPAWRWATERWTFEHEYIGWIILFLVHLMVRTLCCVL
jgi:hypothetical protein